MAVIGFILGITMLVRAVVFEGGGAMDLLLDQEEWRRGQEDMAVSMRAVVKFRVKSIRGREAL